MAKIAHNTVVPTAYMNTELTLLNRQLTLQRWPINQKNRTLQAWDSADEYLIHHVDENNLVAEGKAILLINDSFGTLACWYGAKYKIYHLSDSYVSQQGALYNAEQNGVELPPANMLDSLADLPDDIGLVLLKVPKNNGYLEHLLSQLARFTAKNTRVLGAAKTTDIHTSTLKLFEQYLGPTTTSLAKKKSRLIFSSIEQAEKPCPYPVKWPLDGTSMTVVNHANVFSKDSLDIGARLLLKNIPERLNDKTVIDLGCGNGVIGLSILHQSAKAKVIFADESYMAVASAKDSVALNLPDVLPQCRFVVDDCLGSQQDNSADVILCNPPFHQQQAVTDHIAWQMFQDARRVLKKGGQLIIVGNRNLAYHVKLKRLFGNSQTLDANKKFTVLSATKG